MGDRERPKTRQPDIIASLEGFRNRSQYAIQSPLGIPLRKTSVAGESGNQIVPVHGIPFQA
jgi:hypothetical protein